MMAMLFLPTLLFSDDSKQQDTVIVLKNDKLAIEVMHPTHPDRYNRGVRFTPLAAVLTASMDNQSFFYAPSDHNPIADHGGLAAEFDLVASGDPDEMMPPGYLEAEPGEGFLKIGVGVLEKGKKRYTLFQQPKLLVPAETDVTRHDDDGVRFYQVCTGTNGYAYHLLADVTLVVPRIQIEWQLTNAGSKPSTTRHYTHNFFCFSHRAVGPDYRITFPYPCRPTGLEDGQRQEGPSILFLQEIPRWVNIHIPYPESYAGPNTLLVRHETNGQQILCETSLPSIYTAIHARAGYISPEQFVKLHLEPGETVTWTRTYTLQIAGPPALP